MASPQQMTRDNLTKRGYLVGSVERRKRFPDKKKAKCEYCENQPMVEVSSDLWEIFDIVAVLPGGNRLGQPCTVFAQTTSRANHSTRRNKILASMEAKLVLLSGARILLQSWHQDEPRGRWEPRDEWIDLSAFKQAPNYPNDVATMLAIQRKSRRPDLPPGTTLPLSVDYDKIPF